MKNIRHFALLFVSSLMLMACAGHKVKQQKAALSTPELGSIVETKGSLWYGTTAQVGKPKWPINLTLTVQQVPFNKTTYGNYLGYIQRANKMNSVAYTDSLIYKPKYLRLHLIDKIGLTQYLNNTENDKVRAYLENDDAYKIVTGWSFSATDALMLLIYEADAVLLRENEQHQSYLVLIKGTKEQIIDPTHLEVFDHEFSSFCWGEDRYHNKQIETLLSGNDKCPKGTFKKAAKVNSDRSYLKF